MPPITNRSSTPRPAATTNLSPISTRLTLLRPYKGITFSQAVRVLSIHPDALLVQASDQRLLCASIGSRVHLVNLGSTRRLAARLAHADDRSGILLLTEVTSVNLEWKERESERVQPEVPVHGTLRCGRMRLRACLEDVSTQGASVLAHQAFQPGKELRAGSSVWLDFDLPSGFGRLSLRGSAVYMRPFGSAMARIGVRFSPGPIQNRLLERYTAHRREQILDEIRLAPVMTSPARETQELFF